MSFLGARLLLARLHISLCAVEGMISGIESRAMTLAILICEDFVELMEDLGPGNDYATFYLPRESTHESSKLR